MRIALRVLAALALLLAVLVVAAALVVPRYLDTPAVRDRIQAAALDATGRPLRWEGLSAGLFPPRVELERPELGALEPGAPPLARAERVALVVAFWPLLSQRVVVESLDVDGAEVHWVREAPPPEAAAAPATEPAAEAGAPSVDTTGDAPAATRAQSGTATDAAADAGPAAAPAAAPPEAAATGSEGLPLGVRRVDVRDARITVVDRTVTPPVQLTLQGVDVEARSEGDETPVRFTVSARPEPGGALRMEGEATPGGQVDATTTLDAVELAAFAGYLGEGRRLGGRMSGTVETRGPAAAPRSVDARLSVAEGVLALDGVELTGPLEVEAHLVEGPQGLSGEFDVDATAAELRYQQAFRKPPGTEASVGGRLVPAGDGRLVVDELRVRVKNFEAQGRVETAPPSLALTAPPFELAGWEALVPALADRGLAGRIGLDALRVGTSPTSVQGTLALDGLRATAAGAPPVTLDGRLVGEGTRVVSRDLAAAVGGQRIPLELTLAALDTEPRLELATEARDLDVKALAAAFGSDQAAISGPLDLDARIAAPLGTEAAFTEVVEGRVRFDLGPGIVRGKSLLEKTFARAGAVGEMALSAGQAFGGRDVRRLYGDRYESIAGTLHLAGGDARFDDLRVVYRDYRVDLRGRVDLATRALDATGEITITGLGPGPVRLPISHVGGTVDDPDVSLTPEAVAAVAGALGSKLGDGLGEVLEKATGGRAGKLGDVLRGFLGGGK